MSELQTMNYTVVITPESERIRMDIEISGTDDVPVSCEMSFRAGDALSGTISDLESDGCYFFQEGYAQIQNQGDDLKFGPGKMEHQWA